MFDVDRSFTLIILNIITVVTGNIIHGVTVYMRSLYYTPGAHKGKNAFNCTYSDVLLILHTFLKFHIWKVMLAHIRPA